MSDEIGEFTPDDPPAVPPARPVSRAPELTMDDLLRAGSGLPAAFVGLLERRYLQDLDAGDWRIAARRQDVSQPLFHEVLALGTPRQAGEWSVAMPHVLAACHDPGNSIVSTLFSSGGRQRLYLGGRRIVGQGGRHFDDYLAGQIGAFKAFFSGVRFDASARPLDEIGELSEFLQTAPALAAVTGIPSWKGTHESRLQSLDQLVKATGGHRYALVVAAEPVRPEAMDASLDACRQLISVVHTFALVSRSVGTSRSRSESRVEYLGDPDPQPLILKLIDDLRRMPLNGSKRLNPLALVAGLSTFFRSVERAQEREERLNERQVSETNGTSAQLTAGFLDAGAEACERLLRQHAARLENARTNGWWRTAVYIAAENDAALAAVGGTLRSVCSGQGTAAEPIRLQPLPEYLLRDAIMRGQVLNLVPAEGAERHPFGPAYDTLGTCLSSDELSVLINLPRAELPGIPMRDVSEYGLSAAPPADERIELGVLIDSVGRDLSSLGLSRKTLNRHLFVTGTTGNGKTNTCWQILSQAYEKWNVPFLVIEPAKCEYSRLLGLPNLRGKLRVFSVGSGGLPLRLNPFDWVPGISLLRHISLLKAIMTSSLFPPGADSPFPHLIEDALFEIYVDKGWNLHTSRNADEPEMSGDSHHPALLPNIGDFARKAQEVLRRRNYDEQIQQRLSAALETRMKSLSIGAKGATLNTRRSTPPSMLFNEPAIIELNDVGDESEKSFLMALIFTMLCEHAEIRAKHRPKGVPETLQHITLIEEAHRLLQASGPNGTERFGDPVQKTVSLFTNMLAEMRAYGEGFVIVDQIPGKLAPDTLKNTATKIIHGLAAADDRQLVGACINLNVEQTRHSATLAQGEAIVQSADIVTPVLCRVALLKDRLPEVDDTEKLAVMSYRLDRGEKAYLYRHAGCEHCSAPCEFLHAVDHAASLFVPRLVMDRKSKFDEGGMQPPKAASTPKKATEDLLAVLAGRLRPCIDAILDDHPKAAFMAFTDCIRGAARNIPEMNGESKSGTGYCAVMQVANRLVKTVAVQRSLASQGPVNDVSRLLPEDLLLCESALFKLAPLFRRWIDTPDGGDGDPSPEFTNARAELRALGPNRNGGIPASLFGTPPKAMFAGNPYCARCPSRCSLLTRAGPVVREWIGRGMFDLAGRFANVREATDLAFSNCLLAQAHALNEMGFEEFRALDQPETRAKVDARFAYRAEAK